MNMEQQWVDKYRPKKLKDIISHHHILKIVRNMVNNNCLTHLLFNGRKGSGKSSLIQTIINELYGSQQNIMTLKLNASNHRGIDVVRNEIKAFVTTRMMFSTKPKLVILDEADAMTMDAQLALRRIMDRYSGNAKFCIICNYIRKIHPALISRCSQFRFKPLDHMSMKEKLEYIVHEENLNISDDTLEKIITISNKDMRKAIFMLQALSFEKNQTKEQLCHIFKYPTDKQIQECIDIIELPIEERIEKIISWVDRYGYHLSLLVEIYFDYCLKQKFYDKISKLTQIMNQLHGEYSLKLQIYALMAIF
jgi:replication factor C subunit 3/5